MWKYHFRSNAIVMNGFILIYCTTAQTSDIDSEKRVILQCFSLLTTIFSLCKEVREEIARFDWPKDIIMSTVNLRVLVYLEDKTTLKF